MSARPLGHLAPGLVAAAVLLAHTAAWTASTRYADLTSWRRLWEDLAYATNAFLDAAYGPLKRPAEERPADVVAAYRQVVLEKVAELELRPHEFWRTLRARPFLPHRAPLREATYEDAGRAVLMGWGFRLLGGVSPFLILWLGALAAVPVVLWTAWEFGEAGRGLAGSVYLLLAVSSPFVVESLALARASTGFYVLAVLALVPLAVYAVLGQSRGWRGFAWRAALAAALFTLCACCRSGVTLLFPGYALALVLACERARPEGRHRPLLRRALIAVGLLAAFLLPFALLRPPGHHEVWAGVWEGLGDFDRQKGYTWSDPVAEEVVRSLGVPGLKNPDSQRVLRDLVIRDVRADPGWYATILAKRVGASLTLWKLWPWSPRDGIHLRRSTSPNEGFTDKYWGYTTTVDCFGWGGVVKEVPITALLLPTLALAIWAAWRGRSAWGPPAVVGLMLLATLALPILISTAGGLETQAIALAYFVGVAFLVEEIARSMRSLRHTPVPRKEKAA
jgi:hypothetical protein